MARTALLAVAFAACTDEAQFNVKYAAGFTRAPTTLSIFGVFKDGRMSPEAWDQLGKRLSAPFGPGVCEVACGAKMLSTAPELSAAIDDYARENGVTDELLEKLAPMAKGDLIVLLTIAGHPPQPIGDAGAPPGRAGGPPQATRGRGPGRGSVMGGPRDERMTDQSVFEVSASLYSVRLRQSVGVVALTYSGPTVDEALRKFADRLAVELPGTTCKGWSWEARVPEDPIREMIRH